MSEGHGLSDIIGWALERWPFGVTVLAALGCLYGGLLFGWGPDVVRPVSAQSVQQQLSDAKREVATQINGVQQKVQAISDKQDAQDLRDHADRVERVEQQLLWWRQQNCKSKGQARNYAWQKMDDLKTKYRDLTGHDWQMPTCGDIGE